MKASKFYSPKDIAEFTLQVQEILLELLDLVNSKGKEEDNAKQEPKENISKETKIVIGKPVVRTKPVTGRPRK